MKLYGNKGMPRGKKRVRTEPEPAEVFAIQVRAVKLQAPRREYRFHPKRQWKFDFAWPHVKIAVEVEGGTYVQGRHVRPEGYQKDCEKYNEAALLGWTVLRGDVKMVKDLMLLRFLERALGREREFADEKESSDRDTPRGVGDL